ncbi:selenocysteine lyase isoform X4 [Manis javanica]|uniref:selenocysteine lyase isoform X4 n=1 Tax=Manis javanica TaxID=9974 RepID=UPI003C6D0EF8
MEAAGATSRDALGRAAGPPSGNGEESPPESRKVYMDYNATTPLEPEVIQAMTEAMWEAWGNPSSPYLAGRKARGLIQAARENLAKMIGGEPQDIIFTSGGTEANNLVIHSAVKHFHETHSLKGDAAERHSPAAGAAPHFITCTVEHDSVRLPLEHLVEEHVAEVTFVPVSKVNGRAEAEDILAAVRPSTCLVTVMLANNETGVIMPIAEISQRIKAENRRRAASGLPLVFLHTDAAQALGKRRVDVEDLGVDFLTIVGHKDREHPDDCRPWEGEPGELGQRKQLLCLLLGEPQPSPCVPFLAHTPPTPAVWDGPTVQFCDPQLAGLPFHSLLTPSTWRWRQTPQVKGSVPKTSFPVPAQVQAVTCALTNQLQTRGSHELHLRFNSLGNLTELTSSPVYCERTC